MNSLPEAGVAVNVTVVKAVNDAEHAKPHAIPDGVLVIVPEPSVVAITV